MKKLICFNLIILFLLPFSVKADMTGACSSHDGVDLNIGSDSDGSVICNDGWANSSVLYIPQSPIQPTTCADQSEVVALQSHLISSGSSQYASISSDGLIQACQSSVNQYQASLNNYQTQLILYNQKLQLQQNWIQQAKQKWKEEQKQIFTIAPIPTSVIPKSDISIIQPFVSDETLKKIQDQTAAQDKYNQWLSEMTTWGNNIGNGSLSIKDDTAFYTCITGYEYNSDKTHCVPKVNTISKSTSIIKEQPNASESAKEIPSKTEVTSINKSIEIPKSNLIKRIFNSIGNFFKKLSHGYR